MPDLLTCLFLLCLTAPFVAITASGWLAFLLLYLSTRNRDP